MSFFADKPLSDPCWAERPEGYYWICRATDTKPSIARFVQGIPGSRWAPLARWAYDDGDFHFTTNPLVARIVILSDRLEPPSESHPILLPTEEPLR